jgi:hypothetical protein
VLEYLTLMRIPHWGSNTGAAVYGTGPRHRFVRYGIVGCSDILASLPPTGRLDAIEIKRPGEKPRPEQLAFLAAIAKAAAEHAGPAR